jgi:hypothetical protein
LLEAGAVAFDEAADLALLDIEGGRPSGRPIRDVDGPRLVGPS